MKWYLILFAALLVGCGVQNPLPPIDKDIQQPTRIGQTLYRYIDREAGVVCYSYTGLSCLPISQTKLGEK